MVDQNMEKTEKIFTISTLEQLKVLSDSLRMRIVEALSDVPRTTKQVAALLGEKQVTKLYHHVEALERVGILKLVKTKKNRGTVEKYYRAVAKSYTVDRDLFAVRPQGEEAIAALQVLYTAMLETTIAEIRKSVTDKLIKKKNDQSVLLTRFYVCASAQGIQELRLKLHKLLKEMETIDDKSGELMYALTLAFYPIKKEISKGD